MNPDYGPSPLTDIPYYQRPVCSVCGVSRLSSANTISMGKCSKCVAKLRDERELEVLMRAMKIKAIKDAIVVSLAPQLLEALWQADEALRKSGYAFCQPGFAQELKELLSLAAGPRPDYVAG